MFARCKLRQACCAALICAFAAWLSASADIVDRIVVSVGNQAITLSEVQEAQRLEAFFNRQPLVPLNAAGIRTVGDRLVDQLLLRQEMEASRTPAPPAAEVDQRLEVLKKNYGGDAEFRKVLAGFALDEAAVRRSLALQSSTLRFIDTRFRPMVAVDQADIERYYRDVLIPRLRAEGSKQTPELAAVQDRIDAVLTEERVNQMYEQWLASIRAQASIQYR